MTFGEKYKLLAHMLVCASDIKITTLLWVYSIQHCQFTDVFVSISKAKKHCLICQLGLGVDDLEILRCYGRFLNVEIIESSKYPKLLPRHEKFTHLLIMEVHERLIHTDIAWQNSCVVAD